MKLLIYFDTCTGKWHYGTIERSSSGVTSQGFETMAEAIAALEERAKLRKV